MDRQQFYKKALRQTAARTIGSDQSLPRVWTAQKLLESEISEFLARPVENLAPIQDLRPTVEGIPNPNYGAFFFMVDFHPADDPSHPIQ